MSIDMKLVKELREKVGSGIVDCRQALEEAKGDIEQAVDILRKKGAANALKKSGRVSSEGLIAVCESEDKIVMIELNSETDFVAKNAKFQEETRKIAGYALNVSGLEELKAYKGTVSGNSVQEEITELIAVIGENIQLSHYASVSGKVLYSYVHNEVSENLGQIGVILALDTDGDVNKAKVVAKSISMHIAASAPSSIDIDGLNPEEIEREKKVLTEQAKESGKPDNVIEKMIGGRLKKFHEEVVLLEQKLVMDNKLTVRQFLKNSESEVGGYLKIVDFSYFKLGESK